MVCICKKAASLALAIILVVTIPISLFASGSVVSAYAGSGDSGFADGANAKASFALPMGMAKSKDGSILVADSYSNRIRLVSSASVSTLAGFHDRLNAYGFPMGGYIDGDALKAWFNNPRDIASDSNGNIYVSDSGNNCIRVIASGKAYTLSGTGKAGYVDGKISEAQFNTPSGIAFDRNYNLYIADSLNNVIRKISSSGEVTTVAGKYQAEGGYKDGSAADALFNEPSDVAVASDGTLYVLDCGNQLIRKVANGQVTTFSGKLSQVDPSTGYRLGGFADGGPAEAQYNFPKGIWLTDEGILFVADTWNHRVRAVRQDGSVTTVLGTGTPGNINSTAAESLLNGPSAVLYDSGKLYISDMWNNQIKVIPVDLKSLAQIVGIEGINFDSPSKGIQVWIDKKKVEFKDALPYSADGKTMVPLRYMCEQLGAKVSAPTADGRIAVEKDGKTYYFDIRKDGITFKGNRAMIHIRKLADVFGFKLEWIGKYNAVVVSTK